PEYLNGSFFAQLGQAGAKLLGTQRVLDFYRLEQFGSKERQSGELKIFALGKDIAQMQQAVVGDADDVAGVGLFDQLTSLGEKRHHVIGANLLAGSGDFQAHAAFEAARTDAYERDAIAVSRIHVRLNLEHDPAELLLVRLHFALQCLARAGRRRKIDQGVQDFLYAEIVDGRTEEHRCLLSSKKGRVIECGRRFLNQFNFFGCLDIGVAETLRNFRIVESFDDLVMAAPLLS